MNLGGVIHLNKTGIILICLTLSILFIYVKTNNYNVGILSTQSTVKINLKELLILAIKAAEVGGDYVVKVKDQIQVLSKGKTKEGADDRVTTADYLSHCSMIKTLKSQYQSVTIISEETKSKCDDNSHTDTFSKSNDTLLNSLPDEWVDEKDITVWIDPLDATHEYTEKMYEYVTTMVCVAVKGEPILGVIHKPFSNHTSWAWVKKATSPELQIKKSEYTKKKNITITISRTHSGKIKKLLHEKLINFQLVIAAGAGYKVLEVVTGKVDAYMHITAIKKWDICAGNAVINAVGGKMTNKYNKVIEYKNTDNVVNEEGLVVTLNNHQSFLDLL